MLKLETALAKKSELAWPGWAGLGDKLNIRARLGSGSKASGISKLSSARPRKEVEVPS